MRFEETIYRGKENSIHASFLYPFSIINQKLSQNMRSLQVLFNKGKSPINEDSFNIKLTSTRCAPINLWCQHKSKLFLRSPFDRVWGSQILVWIVFSARQLLSPSSSFSVEFCLGILGGCHERPLGFDVYLDRTRSLLAVGWCPLYCLHRRRLFLRYRSNSIEACLEENCFIKLFHETFFSSLTF